MQSEVPSPVTDSCNEEEGGPLQQLSTGRCHIFYCICTPLDEIKVSLIWSQSWFHVHISCAHCIAIGSRKGFESCATGCLCSKFDFWISVLSEIVKINSHVLCLILPCEAARNDENLAGWYTIRLYILVIRNFMFFSCSLKSIVQLIALL